MSEYNLIENFNNILPIIGAIAGDVIGSCYELKGHRTKNYNFSLFNESSTYTDDTVLTVAVTKWANNPSSSLQSTVVEMCRNYADVGYGHSFKEWLNSSDHKPYNSYGNGAAMRVSSIALKAHSVEEVLSLAKQTAEISHNHREGIKGAQAVAVAIFLAHNNFTKKNIREFIERQFNYNLSRDIESIRESYSFDASCQGSVPEAIIAFLQSSDFEDAIRNAVSLGGDADTQACIAGAIAAAYYGEIPHNIMSQVLVKLPQDFLEILSEFAESINEPIESSVILVAKEDLMIKSAIRYTFALAVTDITEVFVPKGTKIKIYVEDRHFNGANLINHKTEIFERIENDLRSKYPECYEGEEMCNGISLILDKDIYDNFRITKENPLSGIFDLFA